ncbi:uncharacterized protein CIMG_05007 [Coccidioides immitis RS]|uniref:Uncharacterized protein n=1 Tax=Coccidioides immitis (strain RS) TaxID=246410 RepID=J3KEQ1_COCIM|nr:uncharacterized protein CIMG_05007 [Coccidioides immitis RS]EAS33983.3 hypothetical protein CIMG_05007 [Coccidioides immitis RS]
MIRIHLITIGDRTYIKDITSPAHIFYENGSILCSSILRYIPLVLVSAFLLDWILYMFVHQWKSGLLSTTVTFGFILYSSVVIDITQGRMAQRMIQDYKLDKSKYLAIRADEMGVIDIAFQQSHAGPKWILNNLAYPFKAKISVIRL